MKIFAISGLGADKRVFKHLKLDHDLVYVDWIKPKFKESIIDYSKRLVLIYGLQDEKEFGILGVSFGGLIAVEISKQTNPKFTILISSVGTRDEIGPIYKLFGKSKLIDLIPEKWFDPPRVFAYFMFGTKAKELLNSILIDSDLYFTKWAVRELVNWKNKTRIHNLIKIGGTKDKLLPPKGKNTILVEKGEHLMIVDRAGEISEIINEQLKLLSK